MDPIKLFVLIICLTQIHAFEYKECSPESLVPTSRAAHDLSLPSGVSNPASLPYINTSYLHISGANPYSIEKLYASDITFAYKHKSSAFSASYFYFGIDGYSESAVDASYGTAFSRFSLGTSLHYYRQDITIGPQNDTHQLCSGSLAFHYTPFTWISIAGIYDNNPLLIQGHKQIIRSETSIGCSFQPMKGLHFNWNLNKNSFGYTNTFVSRLNILPFCSLKAAYVNETGTYSTSCALIINNIYITYGLRYHRYLGSTHSVGLTYTMEPLRLVALNYYPKTNQKTTQMVDIRHCNVKQLSGLIGVSQLFITRIMKYKKIIGPLSIKALKQISPAKKETKMLLHQTYGYVKDDPSNRQRRKRHNRKYIFKKLLETGLPPSQALELVLLITKRNARSIKEYINTSSKIPADQKKRVYRACLKLF